YSISHQVSSPGSRQLCPPCSGCLHLPISGIRIKRVIDIYYSSRTHSGKYILANQIKGLIGVAILIIPGYIVMPLKEYSNCCKCYIQIGDQFTIAVKVQSLVVRSFSSQFVNTWLEIGALQHKLCGALCRKLSYCYSSCSNRKDIIKVKSCYTPLRVGLCAVCTLEGQSLRGNSNLVYTILIAILINKQYSVNAIT